MKFIKGIMIGTAITAGVMVMYKDNMGMNKKKMMKKGKQIIRKMGII